MKRRRAPSGVKVEELVGLWPHLYRILHPAWMAVDNELTAARWSEVAATGAEIDLAEASWFDVSGHRLHHPGLDAAFASEPTAGPDTAVALSAFRSLLDVMPSTAVLIAEWVGYGRVETAVDGASYQGIQEVSRPSHVWVMSPLSATSLIGQFEVSREPGRTNVIPDRIWDPTGEWLLATDTDLASSYCGTRVSMDGRWASDLEWTPVSHSATIS